MGEAYSLYPAEVLRKALGAVHESYAGPRPTTVLLWMLS